MDEGAGFHNQLTVVVTVRHRDLRRARTPGVGIWFDTNRARRGPEFLAALNVFETYFWPVRRWKVYGEAPLACPMSGGLFYKEDVTRVRVSRDRVYSHGGREKPDVLQDCDVKILVTLAERAEPPPPAYGR